MRRATFQKAKSANAMHRTRAFVASISQDSSSGDPNATSPTIAPRESIRQCKRAVSQWSNLQQQLHGLDDPSAMIEAKNEAIVSLWGRCVEAHAGPSASVSSPDRRNEAVSTVDSDIAGNGTMDAHEQVNPRDKDSPGAEALPHQGPDDDIPMDENEDMDAYSLLRQSLVFHPSLTAKVYWDIFVGILIIYSVISVPFRIGFAFEADPNSFLGIFDWVVDSFFFLDMGVAFRTAFTDEDGDLVTDDRRMARRYLRGSFFVDFASTVPWDKLLMGDPNMLRATKLLRILRIARLLKLLRLLKIGRLFGKPEDDVKVNPALISLAKMLVQLLFISHMIACVWHWIFTFNENQLNWVTYAGLFELTSAPNSTDYEYVNWSKRYANSLYWAFTTMTTVGYGDINPANNSERIFAVVTMLIGASVFGYIIGNVSVMMENIDLHTALYREKMDRVKEYVRDRRFPSSTARRIKNHFKYFYKNYSVFDNAADILSGLPQSVTITILERQYEKLLKGSTFMRDAPQSFKAQAIDKFRPCFVDPGDFIFYEGEVATHTYVLTAGRVQLFTKVSNSQHEMFTVLQADSILGETGLVAGQCHPYSALAASFSSLYTVAKEDLIFILDLFPEVQTALEANFSRIQKERTECLVNSKNRKSAGELSRRERSGSPDSLDLPGTELVAFDGRSDIQAVAQHAEEREIEKLAREAEGDAAMSGAAMSALAPTESPGSSRYCASNPSEDGALSKEARLDPWSFMMKHKLIHPEWWAKTSWDVYICLLIVYSVLTVTFLIGFQVEEQGITLPAAFVNFNYFVDCCFALDIAASFVSTYADDGVVVTDRIVVARTYLNCWFFPDFLSTFPFDLIGVGSAAAQLKLIRTLRLVRLVKISRLLKISELFEKYEDVLAVNPAIIRLLKLLVLMAFVAHLTACVWFYVGYTSDSGEEDVTWIESDCIGGDDDGLYEEQCLDARSLLSKYISAIYWAFTTMTTVGYGDISASLHSTSEIVISIISEVIGTTIFAYVVGTLVTLVLNLDPCQRNRKQQMEYLNNYIRDLSLLKPQRCELRRHYIYRMQFKSVFQEDSIIELMPPHIKSPVLLFLHSGTLPKMPWLCGFEIQFPGMISIIMPKLKPAAYIKDEVVNGASINARELCFVLHGHIRARPANKQLEERCEDPVEKRYCAGKYCAEATLLVPDDMPFQLRVDFVATSTSCHVLILTRFDYTQIKMMYKDMCREIENDLYANMDDVEEFLVLDRERFEAEMVAEDEADDAPQLAAGVPGTQKRDGNSKPKRKAKRGARGRGR